MADNKVEWEQNSISQICGYCGRPPIPGTNLQRCSRCKQAWYHGTECQRNHFRVHKKECRLSTQLQTVITTNSNSQKFMVLEKPGRGRCLVARTLLRKFARINATNQNSKDDDDDGWYPLIPPVLHEAYRTRRCALCFQNLYSDSPMYQYDDIPPNPHYKLLFCSTQCRDAATKHEMDKEEQAVSSLYRRNGPPQILSTAILLYRILVHQKHTGVTRQIEELQCRLQRDEPELPFEGTMDDEASQYHEQGVIVTVMGMLQCSNKSVVHGSLPSFEYMKEMVFRIKINGFSVCDGEFVTYGVGLFSTPSFMNHSCHPNAVQSFTFQKGRLPSLFVTAFRDIQPDEEITISYTDSSCPRLVRQHRLATDYFFHCCCEACKNQTLDAKLVGVKCRDCLSSSVVRIDDVDIGPSRKAPCYRCSGCGRTDFDSTLKILSNFEHDLQSSGRQRRSWEDLRDTYERLKGACHVDSWYVQEAGERYLQRSLDRLEEQREDPVGEQRAGREALRIVEELLLGHPPTQRGKYDSTNTSAFLKLQQLRYKAAKLRLFTMPDPRQSIQELQDVLVSLSPFYPKEHELIAGLKACLMNAFL